MQMQNPQGTIGIGSHNSHQAYVGPTLMVNMGHVTSRRNRRSSMKESQGVSESYMRKTTDTTTKYSDEHQKITSVESEGFSPDTPLVIQDDLTCRDGKVSNDGITSEVSGEQSVRGWDPSGQTPDLPFIRISKLKFSHKSDNLLSDQKNSKEKEEGTQSFLGNGSAPTQKQ